MSARSNHPPDRDEELAALRDELAGTASSTAEIERCFRRIDAYRDAADLKVAWLGNQTLEPVLRSATVAAFTHGVTLANHVGGYGQHFQAVLDPGSPLHAFEPDAVVLWLSLRGLAPTLASGGASRPAAERRAAADEVLEQIERWIGAAKGATRANLLVCNFPRPAASAFGLADPRMEAGDAALYASLNGRLAAAYRHDPLVHVLDLDHAVACAGRRPSWDPQMYYLAQMEIAGAGVGAAAELVARTLCALARPPKKCIALDLDNTLWGGVVGEDGIDGIRIGDDDPVSRAYLWFQRALLDLKARGVLLALASKNNPGDVEEAFARRDMPLRAEDFAARRVDWRPKHVNLCELAEELNIGLDSMLFVDDSPAERELIRQLVPEIDVLELPRDPAEYAAALESRWDFDRLVLTEEDARKTEQYLENTRRAASRAQAADLTSYLASLGTRVEFKAASEDLLPRLHQLFSKTNQFNVTTKRYGLQQVRRFIEEDGWLFEAVRVRDNFGDLGLVGLYLVRVSDGTAEIDSFVLSCRALGRRIETAMLNRIEQRAAAAGAHEIRACFAPTPKNGPAASLYEDHGFELAGTGSGGERFYRTGPPLGAPRPLAEVSVLEVPG